MVSITLTPEQLQQIQQQLSGTQSSISAAKSSPAGIELVRSAVVELSKRKAQELNDQSKGIAAALDELQWISGVRKVSEVSPGKYQTVIEALNNA